MAYGDTDDFDLVSIVSDICGASIGIALSHEFGGTRVFIPACFNPSNALCVFFGPENWAKIAKEISGIDLYVSMRAGRDASYERAAIEVERGAKVRHAALNNGMSERHLYRVMAVRRRKQREARQL